MRKYSIKTIDFNAYTDEELEKMIFFAKSVQSKRKNHATELTEFMDLLKSKGLSTRDLQDYLQIKEEKKEKRRKQAAFAEFQ